MTDYICGHCGEPQVGSASWSNGGRTVHLCHQDDVSPTCYEQFMKPNYSTPEPNIPTIKMRKEQVMTLDIEAIKREMKVWKSSTGFEAFAKSLAMVRHVLPLIAEVERLQGAIDRVKSVLDTHGLDVWTSDYGNLDVVAIEDVIEALEGNDE